MSLSLQIGTKIYQLSNLPEVSDINLLEAKTISFCRNWMAGQLSFEIQTSGSTGVPKRIFLDRKSMIASAMATAQALELQAGQTSLVCLDTGYIAGMMMLVRSMEVGMNMVVVEPSANPFEFVNTKSSVDFAALVPYQVKSILDSPQAGWFNQLKTILIGGAPLDLVTKKALRNYSCTFYETYGMTETISHIALKKLNGSDLTDYFKALPRIVVRQDERGCLCIKAPYLVEEIVTNDVVEFRSPEEFLWLGRWDNVINSGGVKVFPERTEEKISKLFSELQIQNRFFIAGLPDSMLGQAVTLIVEGFLTPDQQSQLRENLKKSLFKYEIPRSVEFVKVFTETATGKINRSISTSLIVNQTS